MTLAAPSHPTLYIEAGIVDDALGGAKDYFWPDDAGPIEKILNLAEFGSMFVLPGVVTILMMVASLMGFSFRNLGRWLDTVLGLEDFEDLANLNISDAIDKVFGRMPADLLNKLQEEAVSLGIITSPAKLASALVPLIKVAAEPDFKMKDIMPDEIKAPSRADEIREQKERDRQEDRAERKKDRAESKERTERKDRDARRDKGRARKDRQDRQEKADAKTDKSLLEREKKELAKNMAKHPEVRKAHDRLTELAGKEKAGGKVKPREWEKARKGLVAAEARAKQTYFQKVFGEAGKRSAASVNAYRSKGMMAGLAVAFTASIGWFKDIAVKLAGSKLGKLSILAAVAAAGIYGYHKYTEEGEPEPMPESRVDGESANKTIFSEEVDKAITDSGEKEGLTSRAPKTFEDKVALQVDFAISAAME